jgi:signal peptidase I
MQSGAGFALSRWRERELIEFFPPMAGFMDNEAVIANYVVNKMNPLSAHTSDDAPSKPALIIKRGKELSLSSLQFKKIMRGVLDKGASFRFQGKGYSMSPFIKDGDVLTIAPVQGATPGFGDVVVFTHPHTGKLIIHRIIGKRGGSYRTKGDNAPEEDGMISRATIVGRVTRVERNGRYISLGIGPNRFIIAFVIRTGLLSLLWPVWRLVRFFMRRRPGE